MQIFISAVVVLVFIGFVLQHITVTEQNVFVQGPEFDSALSSGDLSTVKANVSRDPNIVNQRLFAGETPLSYAAENGHIKVCQYLLDNGADINGKLSDGTYISVSPLYAATQAGQLFVVEFMIDKGADPTINGPYRYKSIDEAEEYIPNLAIRRLIESGWPEIDKE